MNTARADGFYVGHNEGFNAGYNVGFNVGFQDGRRNSSKENGFGSQMSAGESDCSHS